MEEPTVPGSDSSWHEDILRRVAPAYPRERIASSKDATCARRGSFLFLFEFEGTISGVIQTEVFPVSACVRWRSCTPTYARDLAFPDGWIEYSMLLTVRARIVVKTDRLGPDN